MSKSFKKIDHFLSQPSPMEPNRRLLCWVMLPGLLRELTDAEIGILLAAHVVETMPEATHLRALVEAAAERLCPGSVDCEGGPQ